MSEWPLPFWVAHRGAGKLAPENTLAAFRVGASHGYRAFECDAKLSADDVPFLLHDATLQRTTPEHGSAGDRRWAELSLVDAGAWHSPRFAGEPIPSLAAISRYCRANGFGLNVEIKPTPGTETHTGRIVARELRRTWQGNRVWPLLSSFQPDALAGAKAEAPELPRALLLDGLREGWLDEARALGCCAVVGNYAAMHRGTVQALHAAGLRALTYTVNDPSVAQWLIGHGIDGIITDAVDRFAPGVEARR